MKNAVEVLEKGLSYDNSWNVDIKNKILYYIDTDNTQNSLYKFNLNTNQSEKIIDNVDQFILYDDCILYEFYNGRNDELYKYNLYDKRKEFISNEISLSLGLLKFSVIYLDNSVYYRNDNKLIKYYQGNNNTVYSDDNLYIIELLKNNIIVLGSINGDYKYLIDDKVVDSIKMTNIPVNMIDGTIRYFDDLVNYEISINDSTKENSNLDEWIGEYEFYEFAEPNINMFYAIKVYKKDIEYYADINIDGFQTMQRLRCKVEPIDDGIMLVFNEYLEDNVYESYSVSDVLLSLTNIDGIIYTKWGRITPILDENKQDGNVYFEKM